MRTYFDTSVLIALFTGDAFTGRAETFMRAETPVPVVSDFASAEFASAIARLVRSGEVTRSTALSAFSAFDAWVGEAAEQVEIAPADIVVATGFLRRLNLTLRTQDALHIATAQRVDAPLVTFDAKMAACALALKTAVTRA